jgi:hypothetical protein
MGQDEQPCNVAGWVLFGVTLSNYENVTLRQAHMTSTAGLSEPTGADEFIVLHRIAFVE